MGNWKHNEISRQENEFYMNFISPNNGTKTAERKDEKVAVN